VKIEITFVRKTASHSQKSKKTIFNRVAILLALLAVLLATPASAKYIGTGDVVFSTSIDSAPAPASALYPVGGIFLTVTDYADSDAVAAAVGGTAWERWGQGRVPLGMGQSDNNVTPTPYTTPNYTTVEEKGGRDSNTYTVSSTGTADITGTGRVTGKLGISAAYSHTLEQKHLPKLTGEFYVGGNGGLGTPHVYSASGVFSPLDNVSAYNVAPNGTNVTNPRGAYFQLNPNTQADVTGNATQTLTLETGGTVGTDDDNLGVDGSSFSGDVTASGDVSPGTMQPYITCYMWKRVS